VVAPAKGFQERVSDAIKNRDAAGMNFADFNELFEVPDWLE
jgi:hypothetical protein